ncbi:MAG: SIS domain-containing protein, partial [Actinobacteria bacterium]|nr:SIS domain-containing protein [Actinomycetota bacterium]
MSDTSWHSPDYPELRSGPPWVMQEMIARQPELAPAILDATGPAAEVAALVRETVAIRLPVTVCGCGTSEHGALAVAALIATALPSDERWLVCARPALSALLEPAPGLCLAVSHDGGTRATLLALEAARREGARTAAITARPDAAVAGAAELVVPTPALDRSGCHTVAYVSAVLAGTAVAAALRLPGVASGAARRLLADALAAPGYERTATALARSRTVLTAGAGVDHVTARELALKIAEGARIPTVALELETAMHGQLVAHDGGDALVLVALSEHGRDRVARRA